MNILPYPSPRDLAEGPFPAQCLKAQPVCPDAMDTDLSGTGDLEWLAPAAGKSRIFLLGENHYFRITANLRDRIFFTLNTCDHYPLLIMEDQYSKTPFVNHYLTLEGDAAAGRFYRKTLHDMVGSVEERTLIGNMRRWNQINPQKPVLAGYSDIEFDLPTTLLKIIRPYFQKLGNVAEMDRALGDALRTGLTEELIAFLTERMDRAKAGGLTGDFPFITPRYVESVIANLRARLHAELYDFSYYRLKAMVRNITSPAFLGRHLLTGKAMLHGGSIHMGTRIRFPDGGDFLGIGSYLTHAFPPAGGKTASLLIHGYAYCLDEMKGVDLSQCLHQGKGWFRLAALLQRAYAERLISPAEYRLVYGSPDEFDLFLLREAHRLGNRPFRIKSIDWQKILAETPPSPETQEIVFARRRLFDSYDNVMVVPQSPMTRACFRRPSL